MNDEKIKIKTENGQTLEVVVLNKRAERIQIVLGEGVHSVKADLSPTRNGLAYVGSVMGREIIYERSRDQVQADIDRLNPMMRNSSRRRP
jgi:K+/H+ antiporter YhaU regulatory subunit KhtT